MFNSKYSKVLTILLIVAIIAIVALLIFVGINWYQAYTANADVDDGIGAFDAYVNNVKSNSINNNNTTSKDNNTIEPELNLNDVIANTGGSTTTNTRPTYKGFYMVGKIEIPKINIEYPVLESVTPKSIEASVAVLYGPGVNKVGNTVIIGHNWRNGTFFSNNKKLSNGDKIYLTDLEGNKVTYTIYKKYTTGTDDFDYAVRDTKGKREISLSTCTDDSKQRLILWAKED